MAGGRQIVGRTLTSLLVGSLFVSAGLRAMTGAALALEEEPEVPVAKAPPVAEACITPDQYAPLLAALQQREAAADAKDAALTAWAQDLNSAATQIEQRLADLVAAEQALRETVALASQASEADLVQLTGVYENMKPKDAAKLFAMMAPDFAAGFLGRMSPEAAAGILSGLEADHAYAISVIVAGRNAEIPLK